MAVNALQDKFLTFAAYGSAKSETQLDGRSFVKLFRDAGLLKKPLTQTDLDLVFAKVKTKGLKKISYPEFLEALPTIAEKKGMGIEELKAATAQSEGPQSQATVADFVKFHDDTSTFTGVHTRGGPTTVDGERDLKSLRDRTPANNRGVSATSKFNKSR